MESGNSKYMNTKTLLFIAVAAAAAVSCGKTEESAPVATGHKVTLQAGIELPADTKAYVADNDGSGKGAFTWAAGDRIAVYTSDGKFTAFTIDNADAGKASAKFSAELAEGVTAVGPALYPYSETHVNNLDGTVQYNMPTQRDWYNRAVYCPMAAAWTGSGPIEFKQIGGVICVPFEDLASKAQEFTFTSNNSRITGLFNLDLTAANPQITAEATGSASTYTVKFSEPGSTNIDRVFYIPVPVGSYSNVTVKTQRTGGYNRSTQESPSANIVVKRAGIVLMPKLSGATLLEDFEDGNVPDNFTTSNQNHGVAGDALEVVDNPFKDDGNQSDKVLAMNMSNSSTATSGFFDIAAGSAVYGTGYRNNSVAFRFKVHFATVEDAAAYFPRVNFNNKGAALPARINGVEFTPQDDATWATLVKAGEWNEFEYTNSDIVNNGATLQLRNFVTISNGTTKTEGSRVIYYDDFCYLK